MAERDSFYLPMDCLNCGRARLVVYPAERVMECEKCGASGYVCDDTEHEAGGQHAQRANRWFAYSQNLRAGQKGDG